MPVAFSPEAIQDLQSIRAFIGRDDAAAASRMAVRLVAACDQLVDLPHRGRRGAVQGTRELTTVRPYVIVYRVIAPGVQILRVWHGAQSRR